MELQRILNDVLDEVRRIREANERTAQEQELWTAEDCARACGASRDWWDRLVQMSKAPAPLRPTPGVVRWRRREIQLWIDAGMPDRKAWESLYPQKKKTHHS